MVSAGICLIAGIYWQRFPDCRAAELLNYIILPPANSSNISKTGCTQRGLCWDLRNLQGLLATLSRLLGCWIELFYYRQIPAKSVHVGCKDAKKVDRFKKRSAGVCAVVRPCGIIVNTRELLSCESPSQMFAQLLTLRCDRQVELQFVGYDRACELKPFLQNLAQKGKIGRASCRERV